MVWEFVTRCDPRRVVTPLDPEHVLRKLQDLGIADRWQHIVDGLHTGFDIGIRNTINTTIISPNHASAALDPSFIDEYILDKQAAGRYSRAYSPAHLHSLIGDFCTAPLGLVPKLHSSKFRIIQDLSYPRDDVRTAAAP